MEKRWNNSKVSDALSRLSLLPINEKHKTLKTSPRFIFLQEIQRRPFQNCFFIVLQQYAAKSANTREQQYELLQLLNIKYRKQNFSDSKTFYVTAVAVKIYMEDKEHYKALRTLETLIVQEEGATRLLSMTMKIKCQIELDDNDNATVTCVEMVSMFEQINLENQSTTVMNELHDEIKLLVGRFIQINIDSSLLLQRCRFDLIVGFFNGKTRLLKLRDIGFEMQKIAMELTKQNKTNALTLKNSIR